MKLSVECPNTEVSIFLGSDKAEGRRPAAELDASQGRAHHPGPTPEPSERSAERPERSLPLRSQEVQVLLCAQSGGILSGKLTIKIPFPRL